MAPLSPSNESSIVQFVAMTGSSTDVARYTLEASNWNLQMAINLYVDNQMMKTLPVKSNSATKSVAKESPSKVAIRNQQKRALSNDEVRAPIAPKQEVLVKDYQMANQFANWRDRPTLDGHASPIKSTASISPNAGPNRSSVFDTLFRPPVELIHGGTFEAAKKEAELRKKWLLTNIQQNQDFECQVLNRDVWNNPSVRQLLSKWFVFWQMSAQTVEGNTYVTLYKVDAFPHISILDPRTGEKLVTWNKVTAKSFCDNVAKFLAMHSSPGENNLAIGSGSPAHKQAPYDQSEEAQLKAAIEMSLKMSTKSNAEPDTAKQNDAKQTSASTCTTNWKDYLGSSESSKVVLLIRLPNGSRDSVTFPSDTKVKALYLYLLEKHNLSVGTQYDLFTNYPKKNVSSSCDENDTLASVGINTRDTLYLQQK